MAEAETKVVTEQADNQTAIQADDTAESKRSKFMTEAIEWAKSIAFALAVGGLLILFARPSLILGPSMESTFFDKDLVLVEKVSYLTGQPERGEIVICQTDLPLNSFMHKAVIKRVIGLPNDEILITDGLVFLNGELLEEPYVNGLPTWGDGYWQVPADHIFVMGDNRPNSNDSRSGEIGFIPYNKIKGKVYFRVFPFDKMQSY